ncbi:hypothetical protein PHET_05973 [Paragonimus heterotremus]|uniref:Uncharacterized protein n=1 Tax=Paragonimus heterotremus TaxID=100268 RepID=A0A8J4THS3_9TREM|nr:hypothetical protein PHET_05973 [Paragonimus heterotremus]
MKAVSENFEVIAFVIVAQSDRSTDGLKGHGKYPAEEVGEFKCTFGGLTGNTKLHNLFLSLTRLFQTFLD